jgi:hypothetical protein
VPRAWLELPVRAARSLPTFFGRAGLEEGDAGYFLAGTYAINAASPEMLQRGPQPTATSQYRPCWIASRLALTVAEKQSRRLVDPQGYEGTGEAHH